MEIKEAKEILKAGFTWANWTDEQSEAMKIAYAAMNSVEKIEELQKEIEVLTANKNGALSLLDESIETSNSLANKVQRYQEVLKEIADPNSFDDIQDEVTTKRFIAKQALE